jgi:nucleoid-associated protein YgaU
LVFVIHLLRSEALVDTRGTPGTVSPSVSARPSPAGVASSPAEKPPSIRPKDDGPTFDIARIEPSGDAVIAGRAKPGSKVELLNNNEVQGQAVAGQSGEFVIVPRQLPPGLYDLALRSTEADGTQLTSKQKVPMLLSASPDRRPSVAQPLPAPTSQQKTVVATPDKAAVALGALGMDTSGAFHVSGRAEPGASIKLYLNDSYVASATANADRQFAFTIEQGVTPGDYHVRLEQHDTKSDAVGARLEVPFKVPAPAVAASLADDRTRAGKANDAQKQVVLATGGPPAQSGSASAVVIPKVWTTTVIRGDSLWRISRSRYGDGSRYPAILGANRNKIRNPDLIYPGQIFVVPKN